MWFPERGLHVSWSFWLLILLAAIVSPLTIVLSILLAAALHECGHLLALRAFHVPSRGCVSARLARCCTRVERKGSLTGVSLSSRSRAAA